MAHGVRNSSNSVLSPASETVASIAEAAADDRPAGDGTLPRAQEGTTPQHLLLTLLGDYWYNRTEQLPSAALVELLAEFDISEPSARAALNRLTKRGLLSSSKRGRNTYYGLDPQTFAPLQTVANRLVAFGTEKAKPWDGTWTIVAFSVPESQRHLRHAIRSRLRWLGFAALYDGLWCSPWNEEDAALEVLAEIGIDSATIMRAAIDPRSATQALEAWDLDAVRAKYAEFGERFSPTLAQARTGALTASSALVKRTEAMDSWRKFLGVEPNLPQQLLPEDWPRARMRDLFIELYDTLAPVAKARCQQIVAKHDPELAPLVTHHGANEPAV